MNSEKLTEFIDKIGQPIGDDHGLDDDGLNLLKVMMLVLRIGHNIALSKVLDELMKEEPEVGLTDFVENEMETIRQISMKELREVGAKMLGIKTEVE